MLTKIAILQAVNDAVEKLIDDYNENYNCEVMLSAVATAGDGNKSTLSIDGGDVHGVYEITIEDQT